MARDDERTRRDAADDRGRAGPSADSELLAQQARLGDDLSHAAEHQTKPETARADAALGSESGNARRSARAAGDDDPEGENLPSRDASAAAYDASHGGSRPGPDEGR
jgi:hypothetical protein